MSQFKPNFTQIPNEILDTLLDELSGAELKILMYICRRTYGFHKQRDHISFSQLMGGVGKMDHGTGLSKETVSVATKALEERGIILVDRTGGTNAYSVNLKHKVVRKSDQLDKVGSQKTRPKVVRKSDIQKKGNKEVAIARQEPTVNSSLGIFKPLNPTGYRAWFKNKTQRSAVASLIKDFSTEQLEAKVKMIVEFRNHSEPYQFPGVSSPHDLTQKHQKIINWVTAYKKL